MLKRWIEIHPPLAGVGIFFDDRGNPYPVGRMIEPPIVQEPDDPVPQAISEPEENFVIDPEGDDIQLEYDQPADDGEVEYIGHWVICRSFADATSVSAVSPTTILRKGEVQHIFA
jgi:hypothetical protein